MKYALVTGGTKGIGKAVVKRLLRQDYYVFINYAHDIYTADSFEKELIDLGFRQYKFIRADLSSVDNIEVLANEMYKETLYIDTIVLNVGITDYAAFDKVTQEIWYRILDTNLTVPFFLLQRLKEMVMKDGKIVLVSSVMGNYPHGRSIPYGVSKVGVIYLAKLLVKEFEEKRVRVNVVSPGFTETDMQKEKSLEHRKRITDKIALHRFAEAEEIADIIVSVNNNTYINGANIQIDGGYSYF